MARSDRDRFNLPPRLFLYTLDQIADMLMLSVDALSKSVWFDGRSTGIHPRDKMVARNVAASGEVPEWRIEEIEFIRWMKLMKLTPHRRLPRLPAYPDDA